jgi:hypothetical protein
MQHWGKTGALSAQTVEYTLNSMLAVDALMRRYPLFTRFTTFAVMYKSDSPCMENLPDLWWIMRDTLKNMLHSRRKHSKKNMLHLLFMQALPCFHQTSKSMLVDEYIGVVFNVLLALLLGVYKDINKKPHFTTRSHFFELVHDLLTSGYERQQAFVTNYPHLLVLAFMEYIAHVTKAFWSPEYEFLVQENNMHHFFERVPLLCDEFRGFPDLRTASWETLDFEAYTKIHKCSRARRLNRLDCVDNKTQRRIPCDITDFLDAPMLPFRCEPWEYQLLGHALQIPPQVLQQGHELVRVFPLPRNIRAIQKDKLQQAYACIRTRFISSRMYMCMHCMYIRNTIHNRFRLDMYTAQIVCSECMSRDVVSIDMLGRALFVQQKLVYVLCPCCCKVHPYSGDHGSWLNQCSLLAQGSVVHKGGKRYQNHKAANAPAKHSDRDKRDPRLKCDICGDSNYHGEPVERIDWRTGVLSEICFCYKHHPTDGQLKRCLEIEQVRRLPVRRPAWASKG